MTINELLQGTTACACGKPHSCDIRRVVIRGGALDELPMLCADYRHILIVSDNNTDPLCGDRIRLLLGDKLQDSVIFRCAGLLIPDEAAIERLSGAVTPETDLILGIGSGVINDLCKYVSFRCDLPYYIAATAPSMDGYASVGAAMITGRMKTTYNAHVPTAIIGDVDILKNAPMEMIRSGFGDIIGKYSALNDWKLSALIQGEYFCQAVYDLVYQTVLSTIRLADGIQRRDGETIRCLMEALVVVGVGMSYVGNSRPASGSEHHLSHFFEITGIVFDRPYFLHGIDVAYATVHTQLMREELLKFREFPVERFDFDEEAWEQNIRENYGRAADGVIALQQKCGYYQSGLVQTCREKWDAVRTILAEVPSSSELMALLKTVGLDYAEYTERYGEAAVKNASLYAKELKDRFTVLWICYMATAGR